MSSPITKAASALFGLSIWFVCVCGGCRPVPKLKLEHEDTKSVKTQNQFPDDHGRKRSPTEVSVSLLRDIGSDVTEQSLSEQIGTLIALPQLLGGTIVEDKAFLCSVSDDSPLRAVLARTKKGKLGALDYTIQDAHPEAVGYMSKLLTGYDGAGQIKVPILDQSFSTVEINVDVFQHSRSGAQAYKMRYDGVTRLMFMDSHLFGIADVVPSANNMPSELIEKAHAMRQQRDELTKALKQRSK